MAKTNNNSKQETTMSSYAKERQQASITIIIQASLKFSNSNKVRKKTTMEMRTVTIKSMSMCITSLLIAIRKTRA
jgi:hypothetical protein